MFEIKNLHATVNCQLTDILFADDTRFINTHPEFHYLQNIINVLGNVNKRFKANKPVLNCDKRSYINIPTKNNTGPGLTEEVEAKKLQRTSN